MIYKNSANTADSKAFLVGWRTFAMLYGGPVAGSTVCQYMTGRDTTYHYQASCRGSVEILPYGCCYFRNTPGVNVWCYGSQANNTMQGSELDNLIAPAIGGCADSWTNFVFANAKIIGCRLVLAGSMPPIFTLQSCYSSSDGCSGAAAVGFSRESFGGQYGCQNALGQTGHTTVMNTDGVVGTIVCCFDSMYDQTPFYPGASQQSQSCALVHHCNYCNGTCFCCMPSVCNCYAVGTRMLQATMATASQAGLKTLNFYGSANSVLSVAALPNIPPQYRCCGGAANRDNGTACLSCYITPAPTGTQVMKSDKSNYCTIEIGRAHV
jgi:hypothetical protein